MHLKDMSLEELIHLIQSGEKTSKEIFDYFLWRIKKYDPQLKSFLRLHEDGFNKQSKWTPLEWLPFGIKDLYAEKWRITAWASKILESFIPPYDASLIQTLNTAGMSSIWKVNMDEFAQWSSTENSAFQKTLNPWGTNRIPWWTSGGSAAAVAAGLVPASFGSDTGWSLRQPWCLCWVVGFRPSYGRNSRFWIFPMASSFDCPWTITKTVKDAAFLYNITNGEDKKDITTIPWKDEINKKIWDSTSLQWKKIGIPKEYFEEGLDDNIRKSIEEAIAKMKSLWAEVIEVSLPMTKYAIAAYYIIVPAEVATNHARLEWLKYGVSSQEAYEGIEEMYINNRWAGLWEEVKRRTIVWNYVLSAGFYDAYFQKAAKIRTLVIEDFKKAFEQVDVIVSPVSPEAAWKIWEKTDDPMKMYLADAYTIPASLAGLPWISVPCGFVEDNWEKLPVWVQILWPRLWEQALFEVAHVYEENSWWKKQMIPEGFED